MNGKLRFFLKYLLTFISIIIVFNILLLLSSLIPSKMLDNKIKESASILNEEQTRYLYSEPFGVFINTSADAVATNVIYSIDSNSPYESYMKARKNYRPEFTLVEQKESNGEGITARYLEKEGYEVVDEGYDAIGELSNSVDGKLKTSLIYGRYWHGYIALYRPLFTFLNIKQIKQLQLFIYIVLIIIFTILIYKKLGNIPAIIYFFSLACSRILYSCVHFRQWRYFLNYCDSFYYFVM